jgi:hypothetical protein
MVKLSRDHGGGTPRRPGQPGIFDGDAGWEIQPADLGSGHLAQPRASLGRAKIWHLQFVLEVCLTKNIVTLNSSFVHQYPSELSFDSLAISRSTFRKVFILNPNLRPMGGASRARPRPAQQRIVQPGRGFHGEAALPCDPLDPGAIGTAPAVGPPIATGSCAGRAGLDKVGSFAPGSDAVRSSLNELVDLVHSIGLLIACCEAIKASGFRPKFRVIDLVLVNVCDFWLANPKSRQPDDGNSLEPDPGLGIKVETLLRPTTLTALHNAEQLCSSPHNLKKSSRYLADLNKTLLRCAAVLEKPAQMASTRP